MYTSIDNDALDLSETTTSHQFIDTLQLKIGDKLYFYDTRPEFASVIYFHSSIKVKKILQCNLYNSKNYKKNCKIDEPCLGTDCDKNIKNKCEKDYCKSKDKDIYYLKGKINSELVPGNRYNGQKYISIELVISNATKDETKVKTTKVDFRTIFPKLYQQNNHITVTGNINFLKYSDLYLFLSYTISGKNYREFVKVVGFQGNKVIVIRPRNYPLNKKMKVLKIGFAKSYKRGRQNDDKFHY